MRFATVALLSGVAVSVMACGGGGTPPIRSGSSAPSAAASEPVTIGESLCAGTAPGTPLDKAPPSCRHAWRPYGLTVVPPSDIIGATQASLLPDSAVTDAASQVSHADAVRAANAWIRDFAWYIWGEENGQTELVYKLAGAQVVSQDDATALQQGARITYSAACTRPDSATVVAMSDEGRRYFATHFVEVGSPTVIGVTYSQACIGTATFADGHQVTVTNITPGTRVLEAGTLHPDRSLGDIWFTEGTTVCGPGAPAGWCP